MEWWHLRPILPPSALDDPAGLREVKEWMDRAADEIERLREALQWIVDSDPSVFRTADFHVGCKCHRCAMDNARAALGEGK